MPSGKTVKLVLYEALQFAALAVPVFVVMERFAGLVRAVRGGDAAAYWLVVAASLAYVTSVTLLVWVPLKYLILKRRRFLVRITQWRPTALAYVILSTLPCFAILTASSKVQVDGGHRLDRFTELPVSVVLLCLVCLDVVERIRHFKLTGRADSADRDFDMSGPVLTHLEPVTTVSGTPRHTDKDQNGSPPPGPAAASDDSTPRRPAVTSPPATAAYLYAPSAHFQAPSGPLRVLWARDGRSEAFADCFAFWLDTAELVRVAGVPCVYYSPWVFPVYALAFLSTLRLAVAPRNPLASSAAFALQDLPFLAVRVGLLAVFGYVTPVLYPVKNLLLCGSYVYFTLLTRLGIFKRRSMF